MKSLDLDKLIREMMEKLVSPEELIDILEEDRNGSTWYRLYVKNPRYFHHHEGEGLSAFNHIVRKIIESKTPEIQEGGEKMNIIIDINDHQQKRVDSVKATAHMMAERARYFKSNIEVDPMTAFERRIVHEFLADEIDLKTESTGVGRSRRVVIKYLGDN